MFIDHVNRVLGMLRESPITELSTDTSTVAYRVQIAVQRAIARVWNAKQWTFKQRKKTLSLSSGEDEAELPKDIGEPYLVLSSLDPYMLEPVEEDEFDRRIPNPTEASNPQVFMLFEHAGVNAQPASAAVVSVVSSSASDTSEIKVLIKGLVSGEMDSEEVSLNGTTSASTTKSFSQVDSVVKSAATQGRITVTSGATTLLTLAPGEATVRLRKIRVWPEPTATTTLTIKHYAMPRIPYKAYEDSEIPSRWDYVVEQFAFAMSLQPKGQDQINEQVSQFRIAAEYMKDMSMEEKQSSLTVIRPNKAFQSMTNSFDFDTPPAGWNYEEGF